MTPRPLNTDGWSPARHEQVARGHDVVAQEYEDRALGFRVKAQEHRDAATVAREQERRAGR